MRLRQSQQLWPQVIKELLDVTPEFRDLVIARLPIYKYQAGRLAFVCVCVCVWLLMLCWLCTRRGVNLLSCGADVLRRIQSRRLPRPFET